jgi:hypothetical protein
VRVIGGTMRGRRRFSHLLTSAAAITGVVLAVFGSGVPASAVVGGSQVDAATFATDWSFTVGVGLASDGYAECTGSLVDASKVITAAHCVDPAFAHVPDTVYFGSPDISTASHVQIASIDQNPSWNSSDFTYDSAILHLASPVTGVTPIRVATPLDETTLSEPVPVRFAGFGLTQAFTNSVGALYAATSTVTSDMSGSPTWQTSGTPSTCSGDSGGPLVATLSGGEPVLIGATSHGDQTCTLAGFFTDLGRDTFIQNAFYPIPTAVLVESVTPTSGPAPLTVTFDLTGSGYTDARAVRYIVDPTPDSTTGISSVNASFSTNPVFTFTYNSSGSYQALVGFTDGTQSGTTFDTVSITVTDAAPPLAFSGFSQPVANAPAVNTVKNGSTVPVKWSLSTSGNEVSSLDAIASGYPKAVQVDCSTTASYDAVETTVTGSTSLRYDSTAHQYVYDWQTPRQSGTCWRLDIKFIDGSIQSANFKLR